MFIEMTHWVSSASVELVRILKMGFTLQFLPMIKEYSNSKKLYTVKSVLTEHLIT